MQSNIFFEVRQFFPRSNDEREGGQYGATYIRALPGNLRNGSVLVVLCKHTASENYVPNDAQLMIPKIDSHSCPNG